MANTMEYKCPACGGAMEFNVEKQKLMCPYCDSIMTMEEFHAFWAAEGGQSGAGAAGAEGQSGAGAADAEGESGAGAASAEDQSGVDTAGVEGQSGAGAADAGSQQEQGAHAAASAASVEAVMQGASTGNVVNTGGETWDFTHHATWNKEELEGMRVFVCESCGAEIVAGETSGTTTCLYCGNHVVMKGQFSGDLKPDYVLPFKITKEQAIQKYKNVLKDKAFVAKEFSSQSHIEEMKGVYVPYWLFSADVSASAEYDGVKSHTEHGVRQNVTTTEYYDVSRKGRIQFEHVPVDGSKKMDDTWMEAIEPYKFSELKPFEAGFLAGFLSDRYDVKPEDCAERAKQRMFHSAAEALKNAGGASYSNVRVRSSDIHVNHATYKYALCPVWLLTTVWNGEAHLFAVNGQTGKTVGEIPFSKAAYRKYVVTRAVAAFAALFVPALAFIYFL